jgi:hypothetical protein
VGRHSCWSESGYWCPLNRSQPCRWRRRRSRSPRLSEHRGSHRLLLDDRDRTHGCSDRGRQTRTAHRCYVKNDYTLPDPSTAIQVTAKWTCHPGVPTHLDDLKYWWQRVGTDAYSIEEGLLRFEAYQVVGEDALIIHETFKDSDELKFHLSKGTAEKYKKDIDQVAAPEAYFFRGPVSWTIRTYSRFLHLPATYSSRGSHHTKPGGSMSSGRTT